MQLSTIVLLTLLVTTFAQYDFGISPDSPPSAQPSVTDMKESRQRDESAKDSPLDTTETVTVPKTTTTAATTTSTKDKTTTSADVETTTKTETATTKRATTTESPKPTTTTKKVTDTPETEETTIKITTPTETASSKPATTEKPKEETKKAENSTIKTTQEPTTKVDTSTVKTTQESTTKAEKSTVKTTQKLTPKAETTTIKTTPEPTTKADKSTVKTTQKLTPKAETTTIKTTQERTPAKPEEIKKASQEVKTTTQASQKTITNSTTTTQTTTEKATPTTTTQPKHKENTTVKAVVSKAPEDDDMGDVMLSLDDLAEKSGISCPADILFVVDSTNSVRKLFEDHKAYIVKVLEGIMVSDRGDHVGVILYSGPRKQREKIKLGTVNNNGKLVDRVKGLPFLSGTTATGAALNFTKGCLGSRRPNVPTSVVVITDGFSYDDLDVAAKALQEIPNVRVFAVTIGDSYIQKQLEVIAGSAERVLKGTSSYARLVRSIKQCDGGPKNLPGLETSTVHYVETATDSNGRHLIPNPRFTDKGVEHLDDSRPPGNAINGTKSAVDALRVFNDARRADEEGPTCINDIVFIFDASGSLKSHFASQLELANQLVEQMQLGPEETKVAAIKYAGKKKFRVLFDFQHTFDKSKLKSKILKTRFMSGTTYTNEALVKAASLLKSEGSRPEKAKPVVFLFTDGYSGESPADGAQALRDMGVAVYVIGIDDNANTINHQELQMIAGDESKVYLISRFESLVKDWEEVGKKCLAAKKLKH